MASTLIVIAIIYGWNHKNNVQYKRAMTISDLNQELQFSKTGSSLKLIEQKRYKDMTVIPIEISADDRQSLNAKEYLIGIMPLENGYTKEELEKNVSANLVFFGTNGEGAIVLRGNLPKAPLQIILQNRSDFSDTNSGPGTLMIEGKESEVDYNGVAFTINPKGDNVKKDSKITPDMKMSDLYLTAIGDKQYAKLKAQNKQSIKEEERLNKQKTSIITSIQQMNNAIGKDKDDLSIDETVSSNNESTAVTLDEIEGFEDTNMDNADIESLRNEAVYKLEDVDSKIEDEKRNQDSINIEHKNLDEFVDKMYDLVSINDEYQIIDNE